MGKKQKSKPAAKTEPPAKQRRPPKKKPPPITFDRMADVATHFRVSYKTVKDWRLAGMPGRPRHWILADIEQWKSLRVQDPLEKINGESNPLQKRRLEAELRIKEAEAIAKERKNRIEEGNIVDRIEVERLFSALFGQMRDQVLAISNDMKPSFPRACREQLGEELDERLRMYLVSMNQWGKSYE